MYGTITQQIVLLHAGLTETYPSKQKTFLSSSKEVFQGLEKTTQRVYYSGDQIKKIEMAGHVA
jgi:hypothetical protein